MKGNELVPPVGGSDDAKKLGMVGILQNVAAGAGLNAATILASSSWTDNIIPSRQEDSPDQARGRDPVEPRHIHVHQNHIGLVSSPIEGLAPIGRLSDHSQVRFSFEEQPKACLKSR